MDVKFANKPMFCRCENEFPREIYMMCETKNKYGVSIFNTILYAPTNGTDNPWWVEKETPVEWLKRHRCPWCSKRKKCQHEYRIDPKPFAEYRCHGYRSDMGKEM